MKATKKTKKDTKPMMIVNLTNIEQIEDISDAFIVAKINAGIPITKIDLYTIRYNIASRIFDLLGDMIKDFDENIPVIEDDKLVQDIIKLVADRTTKKQPWYKRFWNWVKKPFTKKK